MKSTIVCKGILCTPYDFACLIDIEKLYVQGDFYAFLLLKTDKPAEKDFVRRFANLCSLRKCKKKKLSASNLSAFPEGACFA